MTVGQHDDAWMNVMARQIPNGVAYIKELTNRIGIENQLKALEIAMNCTDYVGLTKEEWIKGFKSVTSEIGWKWD